MTTSNTSITRRNGEVVPFDPERLRRSLVRSGAGKPEVERTVAEVEAQLHEGMSTQAIYKTAFRMLRKHGRGVAARYSLKQAIFQLGPTGFPFEKYVAALLAHQGCRTQVGVIVQGACVDHEVDVIAEQGEKHFMVECKFHSDPKRKCDVKIPLYIQARFKDVEASWVQRPGHQHKFHQGWLVTNTRFTSDAIAFGECAGLHLISWDHPRKGSLRELIDRSALHPITCLTSLSRADKQRILDQGTVLCADVLRDPTILSRSSVDPRKTDKVLKEIDELCSIGHSGTA